MKTAKTLGMLIVAGMLGFLALQGQAQACGHGQKSETLAVTAHNHPEKASSHRLEAQARTGGYGRPAPPAGGNVIPTTTPPAGGNVRPTTTPPAVTPETQPKTKQEEKKAPPTGGYGRPAPPAVTPETGARPRQEERRTPRAGGYGR